MPYCIRRRKSTAIFPQEVQNPYTEELNISPSIGTRANFLHAVFPFNPRAQHRIKVLTSSRAYVKGSDKILAAVERELRISCGESSPDGRFQ